MSAVRTSSDTASRRVAVLGAGTPLGTAVLQELSAGSCDLDLLAVDSVTPGIIPPRANLATCDTRDRLLPLTLAGVDVVVHAPTITPPGSSADALHGRNVGGTRNVLDAAEIAGVGQIVVIVSAAAYGAHDDADGASGEETELAANAGYPHALHQQLIDEMVVAWADAHPDVAVARLRVAPVLGVAEFAGLSSRLLAPRLIEPIGASVRWQFIHQGDVASAVGLVVSQRLSGVFNVASNGWLDTAQVARILGREVLPVSQQTLRAILDRARMLGVAGAASDAIPFLRNPPVIDAARLVELGWTASRTNADVVSDFAARNSDWVALGRRRLGRGQVRRAIAGAAGLLTLALWRMIRR